MKIDILTLFPNMFDALNHSILGKAKDKELIDINIVDYRKFSGNKHNQVDDYPFGGGQGMVIKPEPIFNAVESLKLELFYFAHREKDLAKRKLKNCQKKNI